MVKVKKVKKLAKKDIWFKPNTDTVTKRKKRSK